MGLMVSAGIIRRQVNGRIRLFSTAPFDGLKHRQSVLRPIQVPETPCLDGYGFGHRVCHGGISAYEAQCFLLHVMIRFHLKYRC